MKTITTNCCEHHSDDEIINTCPLCLIHIHKFVCDENEELKKQLKLLAPKLKPSRKEYMKAYRRKPDQMKKKRARDEARKAKINNRTFDAASLRFTRWEINEDSFLLENCKRMTMEQMAIHLKRSFCSVKARLGKLRNK